MSQPKILDPNDGIAKLMWKFLNTWPHKPVRIGFDSLEKLPPAMALQQLSGTVVEQRFIHGGFVGRWPFAVYYRANGEDTNQRLVATTTLNGLASWIKEQPLPNIGSNRTNQKIEMVSTPAKMGDYNDGTEVYQAIFSLQYKEEP